ncbi:hypothetical protein T439DRAFT_236116 [Meredithblackwellia eburnea MCA 4105]
MAPPPLPEIITTTPSEISTHRPSTPPPPQSASISTTNASPSPITPPPTFSISPAQDDDHESSSTTTAVNLHESPRTPSHLSNTSNSINDPPSPTGSYDPFIARTSLGLRDNHDVSFHFISFLSILFSFGIHFYLHDIGVSHKGTTRKILGRRTPSRQFQVALKKRRDAKSVVRRWENMARSNYNAIIHTNE